MATYWMGVACAEHAELVATAGSRNLGMENIQQ